MQKSTVDHGARKSIVDREVLKSIVVNHEAQKRTASRQARERMQARAGGAAKDGELTTGAAIPMMTRKMNTKIGMEDLKPDSEWTGRHHGVLK